MEQTASRHVQAAEGSARNQVGSDLVVFGDLGFVTGVKAVDLANDRAPLPEMVEAQTRRIFANLDAILAAGGIGQRRILSVQVRLVDFERLIERLDRAYARCIGPGPLPARGCSGVSRLTRGALVEMDFIVDARAS